MADKIRVLVIDDSALIRSLMQELIDSQPDMTVVGTAPDPIAAREMIKALNPDVLTLDVEMPRMNGLDFLEKLMRLRPMPVIMVSALTEHGSEAALQALSLGAVDFIAKPRLGITEGMAELAEELGDKIRTAAGAHLRRPAPASMPVAASKPVTNTPFNPDGRLIFIGASTGGTEALKEVLTRLPANAPAVLAAQHMPESFIKSFAHRLDSLCAMTVKEARHHEKILPGHVYISPGETHLLVRKSGTDYYTDLSQSEPVNRHRPSVDMLFHSAARAVGPHALGILLTGMGKDGAAGLLEMRNAGAHTIAQDEASCVVFGMPRAAIELGAAQDVLPLTEITQRIIERLSRAR